MSHAQFLNRTWVPSLNLCRKRFFGGFTKIFAISLLPWMMHMFLVLVCYYEYLIVSFHRFSIVNQCCLQSLIEPFWKAITLWMVRYVTQCFVPVIANFSLCTALTNSRPWSDITTSQPASKSTRKKYVIQGYTCDPILMLNGLLCVLEVHFTLCGLVALPHWAERRNFLKYYVLSKRNFSSL